MLFDRLQKLLEGPSGDKKMRPIHYLIILLCLGATLMLFTDFLAVDRQPDDASRSEMGNGPPGNEEPEAEPVLGRSEPDIIREYENAYETRLEEMLEAVVGVGEVEVMVNLDSTPELVTGKNTNVRNSTTKERDKDQATRDRQDMSRDEEVVVIQGEDQDQPIIVKKRKPQVRGVLVVAKGAENVQVRTWIAKAVGTLLDVPIYKVTILPKKG